MRGLLVLLVLASMGCGSRTSPLVELPDASSRTDSGVPASDAGLDAGPVDGGAPDAGSPIDAGSPAPLTSLSAGSWFTCASDSSDALFCWGRNGGGQLGDGSTEDRPAPVSLRNGLDGELVQVSAGSGFVCGVDRSGDVWCWGRRIGGYELSGSAGEPVQIPGVAGAVRVEAGQSSACALHADGGVSCWGSTYMQRGGECRTPGTRQPSRVDGATRAVQIGVGAGSHCLLRDDGTVHCWGCNARGRLGIGDMGGTFEAPIRVEGVSGVVDLSVGWDHSCALQADGQSFCWGAASSGALGNGEVQGSHATPQRTLLPRADAIFAGNSATTCATVGGAVFCAGGQPVSSNAGGCSGRASSEWVQQPGLPPIDDMSLSFGSDLCARSSIDDSVWCWGCNAFGGVGVGAAGFVAGPVQVLP